MKAKSLLAFVVMTAFASSARAQWMTRNLERPVARAARTYWPGDRYHRPGYGYAVHERQHSRVAPGYGDLNWRGLSTQRGGPGYKALYRPPHQASTSSGADNRGAQRARYRPTGR